MRVLPFVEFLRRFTAAEFSEIKASKGSVSIAVGSADETATNETVDFLISSKLSMRVVLATDRNKLKLESILMTEKDDFSRRFGDNHSALSSYQATEGVFGHAIAESLLLFRGF